MDETNVYWALDGGVQKCAASGCGGHPTTLATGQTIESMAIDATRVYWSGGSTVMTVSKMGGTPTALATGQGDAVGVAVDATNVYWADREAYVILRAPLDGGSAITLAGQVGAFSQDVQTLPAIAVDSTRVYWVQPRTWGVPTWPSAPISSDFAGGVVSAPTGGGPLTYAYIGYATASGPAFDGYAVVSPTSAYAWNALNQLVRLAKPLQGQIYPDGGLSPYPLPKN
jgi:hypothetical protein